MLLVITVFKFTVIYLGCVPSLNFSDDEGDLPASHNHKELQHSLVDMPIIEEHYDSVEDLTRSLIAASLQEDLSASLIDRDNSQSMDGEDNSGGSSVYDTARSVSDSYVTPSSCLDGPSDAGMLGS